MGRKVGTLRINPKKFGSLHKPCMKEMMTFLNCLAVNHNSDEKCVRNKELLNTCMDAQNNNRKLWGSINYHMQRLSRGKNSVCQQVPHVPPTWGCPNRRPVTVGTRAKRKRSLVTRHNGEQHPKDSRA
ncbi:hypothetical protein G4B88_003356 [Cannabis sativa]|uniref:IMS import disulfide relay-system CHCH-CHCH-like Cx9C domain-containing protein n=1 Tax=Cannabis sativa TaxID=3483 RepID=A0A7J6EPX8_CANSA|nr:hypothetical protein G4B88_003356 [Cannabis sativa]